MSSRCIIGDCSNVRNLQEGIALHTMRFYGNERAEAKKRRKRWAKFVRQVAASRGRSDNLMARRLGGSPVAVGV